MKTKLAFLTAIFALLLSACGSATATPASATEQGTSLDQEMTLLVGVLKLADTDQAIASDQAGELLLMWQVYQELLNSDTAAQEEIDGLLNQIEQTLTSEQTAVIDAMNLTQQDVSAIMQEQGLSASAQSGQADSGAQNDNFSPPDGGEMMMGGSAPVDMVGSTTQSDEAPSGAGADMSSVALLEAVIDYLKGI